MEPRPHRIIEFVDDTGRVVASIPFPEPYPLGAPLEQEADLPRERRPDL